MRGVEKVVRKAAVFIGALLAIGGSSTAFASGNCDPGNLFTQDPNVCVYLSAPAEVAYSEAGEPRFLTVSVKIENKHANVLNRVKINGRLSPASRSFVDYANGNKIPSGDAFTPINEGSASMSCTVSTEGGTGFQLVTCGGTTGVSIPVGGAVSIKLMIDTPDPTGNGSLIGFEMQALFAEGGSTSETANNGTASGTTITTVTATGSNATASFPQSGGTLSTTSDTFTTKISIPATGKSLTATITEARSSTACKSFRKCYSTEISIPGLVTTQTDPLKVYLFAAASNIKGGVAIENVKIYYTDDNGNRYQVGLCQIPDQADAPINGHGLPCLNKYFNYTRKSTPPAWVQTTLGFGFHWQLLNTNNGSFTVD